jgi:peptidoglycan L-alanyl-D-glutamate endopeptidase CwlK
MSRSLDDLRPEFRIMVDAWLADMKAMNLVPLITCTLRTGAEQDALYAKGRTAPGAVVTHARANQSAHQYGLAIDFVIMDNGKPDWSGTSEAWNDAIELAQNAGMVSLRPMESAHLQHPNWKVLSLTTLV